MYIPPFYNSKFVNKDGYLTGDQQIFIDTLIREMRSSLGSDGLEVPQQTTANINSIVASMPVKTLMFHDIDTNELKVIMNGVVKVIPVI